MKKNNVFSESLSEMYKAKEIWFGIIFPYFVSLVVFLPLLDFFFASHFSLLSSIMSAVIAGAMTISIILFIAYLVFLITAIELKKLNK